jgi:hypothetical protein
MMLQQLRPARLAMMVFVFALAAIIAGCNRDGNASMAQDNKSALVGKYVLTGQSEAASEIELYANGKFEYAMIYGAVDEIATGTWHEKEARVVLELDKDRQGSNDLRLSDRLELRRDQDRLVMTRNDIELVYLKAPSAPVKNESGDLFKPRKPKELDILGYNYTDDYIPAFNVDGYGGGNVELSTETAGGGKAMCCYPYIERTYFPFEVEVEWGSSDRWGPTQKKKVLVPEPKGANPRILEIHFYPDGHIEAELTDWYSLPRLQVARKK